MTPQAAAVVAPVRRPQLAVAAVLALVVACAWAWLVPMARDMRGAMDGPAAWMMRGHWDWPYVAAIFVMWTAMMAGMMLPSAAPVVLLYTRFSGGGHRPASPIRGCTFAGAYVLAWAGLSLAATALQWGLSVTGLVSPMMATTGSVPGGLLLLAAGAYQATPLKQRCLSRCRSPLAWIAVHWKPGLAAALRIGVRHGLFCVGCCWVLMLLHFAGGVMSLSVMAGVTIVVLAEKLTPAFVRVDRLSGVCLCAAGLWLLLR